MTKRHQVTDRALRLRKSGGGRPLTRTPACEVVNSSSSSASHRITENRVSVYFGFRSTPLQPGGRRTPTNLRPPSTRRDSLRLYALYSKYDRRVYCTSGLGSTTSGSTSGLLGSPRSAQARSIARMRRAASALASRVGAGMVCAGARGSSSGSLRPLIGPPSPAGAAAARSSTVIGQRVQPSSGGVRVTG